MTLVNILKGQKRLQEQDRKILSQIESYDPQLEKIEKAKQALEKQKQRNTLHFRYSFGIENLDQEIKSYLENHGFRRAKPSCNKSDALGTFEKNFEKNPTYISEEGYVFRIEPRKQGDSFYRLMHTRDITNIDGIIAETSNQLLREKAQAGAAIGSAIGLFFGFLAAAIEPAAVYFVVPFLGVMGGMMGFGGGMSTGAIKESNKRKDINTLATGTYASIEKLLEIYGEK